MAWPIVAVRMPNGRGCTLVAWARSGAKAVYGKRNGGRFKPGRRVRKLGPGETMNDSRNRLVARAD